MKITKYGHACLFVEEAGVALLIDLGSYSSLPSLAKVDAILITHEHGDHIDLEKIKAVRTEHPDVQIITVAPVGKILESEKIAHAVIKENDIVTVGGVSIESFGHDHAIIYGDVSPCVNTGYLISEKLFVPGDALDIIPSKPVSILALPTSGPWMKLSEAINYAKRLKPKVVFPIHDGLYLEEVRRDMIPRLVGSPLEQEGITFVDMPDNVTLDF